jgi:hypothetical protein
MIQQQHRPICYPLQARTGAGTLFGSKVICRGRPLGMPVQAVIILFWQPGEGGTFCRRPDKLQENR